MYKNNKTHIFAVDMDTGMYAMPSTVVIKDMIHLYYNLPGYNRNKILYVLHQNDLIKKRVLRTKKKYYVSKSVHQDRSLICNSHLEAHKIFWTYICEGQGFSDSLNLITSSVTYVTEIRMFYVQTGVER